MNVVLSGGLEIAYERAGEGPPLVFVHGAADDSRIWKPQLSAFADEFTVVAWDEPGAGRSSDVPTGFGLSDYAKCLATLIEALASVLRMSSASPGAARSSWSSIAAMPSSSRP